MEDRTKQMEDLQKFQENPEAFFEAFVKPEKHVGQWLVASVSKPKEKGYLVKTKYGSGRTKHSDQPVQGKLPVYLDNGQRVLLNAKNIKLTGFID